MTAQPPSTQEEVERRWKIRRVERPTRFKDVLDGPALLYGEEVEVMPVTDHEQKVKEEQQRTILWRKDAEAAEEDLEALEGERDEEKDAREFNQQQRHAVEEANERLREAMEWAVVECSEGTVTGAEKAQERLEAALARGDVRPFFCDECGLPLTRCIHDGLLQDLEALEGENERIEKQADELADDAIQAEAARDRHRKAVYRTLDCIEHLRGALQRIATERSVTDVHGEYEKHGPLGAEECREIARAALATQQESCERCGGEGLIPRAPGDRGMRTCSDCHGTGNKAQPDSEQKRCGGSGLALGLNFYVPLAERDHLLLQRDQLLEAVEVHRRSLEILGKSSTIDIDLWGAADRIRADQEKHGG